MKTIKTHLLLNHIFFSMIFFSPYGILSCIWNFIIVAHISTQSTAADKSSLQFSLVLSFQSQKS